MRRSYFFQGVAGLAEMNTVSLPEMEPNRSYAEILSFSDQLRHLLRFAPDRAELR